MIVSYKDSQPCQLLQTKFYYNEIELKYFRIGTELAHSKENPFQKCMNLREESKNY